MAVKIYRFELTKPAINESQLASEVGYSPTLILNSAGGQYIDIVTEEAFVNDLIDAMNSRGFTFISESPTININQQFAGDNPNDYIYNIIDSQVVIISGHTMQLDDPEIMTSGSIEILDGGDLVII